jgi:hypothetical protein
MRDAGWIALNCSLPPFPVLVREAASDGGHRHVSTIRVCSIALLALPGGGNLWTSRTTTTPKLVIPWLTQRRLRWSVDSNGGLWVVLRVWTWCESVDAA